MYQTSDTIAAVSSPPGPGARHMIRISGPDALRIVAALAGEAPVSSSVLQSKIQNPKSKIRSVRPATLTVKSLAIPCHIYSFPGPHSYTGDDMAELHLATSQAIAAVVLEAVTSAGARLAGPGEFTARAYLSGKLDLAQAEAVAEIISAGNRTHLAAAEKLLEGRLTSAIADIRKDMLELISLIEAGLDFSEEGIDFITVDCAAERLRRLAGSLEGLLCGSIRYEAMLDLPAVAIAGATNAGKSSLLNALLGKERSIVSDQPATTRDILTDIMHWMGGDCVIFDCAGLSATPQNVIDELSQAAAVKAVNSADLVILCLDASKDSHAEDERLFSMLSPAASLRVATKSDLAGGTTLDVVLRTSAKTDQGIAELKQLIARRLKTRTPAENSSQIALTQRHITSVKSAIENLDRSLEELTRGNSEITSMFLRSAWTTLGPIESEPIDEAVLNNIFSRFCIGK